MATGENGANGACAQRHVNKENSREHVSATHLRHNMAETNAKETQVNFKIATDKSRAQVSQNIGCFATSVEVKDGTKNSFLL